MSWYKKVITKNIKGITTSAVFVLVFSLSIMLWHFVFGKHFQWIEIEPIEKPPFWPPSFYSALSFVTFGAFLYFVKFYRLLYFLVVKLLGEWGLYIRIKKVLWIFLTFLTYNVAVKVIDFLNMAISFVYNVVGAVLYAIPPLGFSGIVFILILYFYRKNELAKKGEIQE